jgi:hypothetical protein
MQPFSAFSIVVIEGELLRPKDGELDNGGQWGKFNKLD